MSQELSIDLENYLVCCLQNLMFIVTELDETPITSEINEYLITE